MKQLSTGKTMTVKETADALGVSVELVTKRVRELFPGVMKKGRITRLTEKQVTAIKMRIQQNSSLATSHDRTKLAEMPKTDLEMLMYDKMVSEWKDRKIAELTDLNEQKEKRIGRLVHTDRTFTSSEIGKELGFKSGTAFKKFLYVRGIQYKDQKGVWLLYSKYSALGYEEIKQEEKNGKIFYHRKWTGKGRDWLLSMFAEESA